MTFLMIEKLSGCSKQFFFAYKAALRRKIAELKHDNSTFNQELHVNKTEIESLRSTIVGLRKAKELYEGPKELQTLINQIIGLEQDKYDLQKKLDKAKVDYIKAVKAKDRAEASASRCKVVNKQLHDENCRMSTVSTKRGPPCSTC